MSALEARGPLRLLVGDTIDASLPLGRSRCGLDGNASFETARSYGDRDRVLADLGWSLVKGRA